MAMGDRTRCAAIFAGALLHGACTNDHGDGGAFNADTTAADEGTATSGASQTSAPGSGTGSGTGTATAGTTAAVDDTAADTGPPPTFDVGGADTDFDLCGCAINYIWIANADDSTVSKINTKTLEEEARYLTREDAFGSPSRTSVSFTGDVVVANRYGGLTKFWADAEDCVESNGMAGIQTSSGAGDLLSWDMEECRAWFTEFPTTNQRPVAWAPPDDPRAGCEAVVEQRLWTVGSTTPGIAPGTGGAGGVTVWLVDGEDGSVLEEIAVPDFPGVQLGAYGGAVDGQGNLFFSTQGALTFGVNWLARVDIDTLAVTIWPVPENVAPYGITVDHLGRPWLSSMLGASGARFDPVAETWDILPGTFTSQAGLMESPDGWMWIGTGNGAISIDVDTLEIGKVFVAPGGGSSMKGISIDIDGYVWAVNQIAYKVDPDTAVEVGSYNGLSSPYTYSDMTGWALQNAACPPAG
jgi:hypothetical protein